MTSVPGDPKKAKCVVCLGPSDSPFSGCCFSIGEGFYAVKKHSATSKHKTAIENTTEKVTGDQMRIEKALKNQEEITKKDRNEKDKCLR